jgi:putative membrane-bound dehydrogenase-like protein
MKRLLFGLLFPVASLAQAPKAPEVPAEVPPAIQSLQPGVKLTLLAEHPDLVTPTGIDVAPNGQLYLIASHTHFRPEGYAGPEKDEVLVFDANGQNRRVFYNRTVATMQLSVGPDGWIYLAERSRILRVRDSDGDGQADTEEDLATLDTLADYPHNGLSGMAWHPDGGLVFSLGENFGKDWTLTARDGSKVSGRGEGGVFHCTPDGNQLRRLARGFWNPFGLLVRDDGEIFAADNDPGSRPPCRLLNVVEGADYGFQWVYGRAPVHPFVAWNGELRGTLGMVHPSGEGPCSVVELGGGVMIPSWSNHCIDYFPLRRRGAGYESERIELLRGSDFFRPVCLAPGPDGAFYLTDWVFSSYPIHGRGRLWKLEIDREKASWLKPTRDPLTPEAELAKALRSGQGKWDEAELFALARGADSVLADAALTALARQSQHWTPERLKAMPAADRVWALVALRRVDLQEEKWLRALWADADLEVRFECLRWVADAVLTSFTAEVEKTLSDATLDFRLFEAALAAWNTLRGNPEAGVTDPEVLFERLTHAEVPPALKGYALRLLPASDKRLTVTLLRELFAIGEALLATEVVRSLAARDADDARALLAEIAADEAQPPALRTEAITGLATSAQAEHQALLVQLAGSSEPALSAEALRALRFTEHDQSFTLSADRPPFDATAAWLERLDALAGPADVEAGRRLFFHPKLAICASCHRHSGRGNVVGPDLTLVSQQGDRESLLRSILEPHREVAPQYFPTQLRLQDGSEFTGILLRSSSTEVYRDLTGRERVFQKADIVQRTELRTSLMPAGLVMSLTDHELRDLLAFLTADRVP